MGVNPWAPSKQRGSYDFECWNWVNPRACGLLWKDNNGRQQWEYVVDKNSTKPHTVAIGALEHMAAIAKSDGIFDWWAHNGGKYDTLFILDACIKLGWEVTGNVAAGRVIMLFIKAPDLKKQLHLYDSMAVIPSSLKNVAKDFHLKSQKLLGDDDYSLDVRKWPLKRLEAGCRADCEVVLEALDVVEALLEERGGGLRATFSSAALSVLESQVQLIDTRSMRAENEIARAAYIGGRVEIFEHIPQAELSEWDVTSSYPWAMTQGLPWAPIAEPVTAREVFESETMTGLILAEVAVPTSMHIPPLPWVHAQGGVYFPTGKWQAWFHVAELRYAMSLGVKAKFMAVAPYTLRRPFADYIADFFKIKAESTGAVRNFTKLILNGSYGKFGQKPERETLRVFTDADSGMQYLDGAAPDTVRVLSDDPRFLAVATCRWAKRTHYALAGAITAHSRILLHRALSLADGAAYCDTDSVHAASTSHDRLAPMLGSHLGALKLEHSGMTGRYYAPKIYATKFGTETKYVSKGFPVNADSFAKVISGEAVVTERMQLAKTQLRSTKGPARRIDSRVWAGRSMKRKPFDDGSTRPWTVTELEADAHLTAMSPKGEKK